MQARRRGRLAAAFLLSLAAIRPELVSATETRSGTIEILTADDFGRGVAQKIVNLVTAGGVRYELALSGDTGAAVAEGAVVRVVGTARGSRLEVDSVEVLEASSPGPPPAISGETSVIAILIKFNDTTTEPYTVAQIQNRMFGDNGVAEYYAEASYGIHTLGGIVTNWLTATIPTPTTCDYISVSQQGDARATDAGYNPYSYQKRVYIFPHIPCGWLGLGGGSSAWINQAASNLVVGHELGHCFGQGHSSSLDCGPLVLGGTCSISEYGDAYSVMGNSQARHFPASMKNSLGYLPAGTVATHASGSATYTLAPIEVAGGSLYAVKVPIAETGRTYWLEYRQPIGFDSTMSGNPIHGTLMRLGPGYPAYSCNTCLLDMTPTVDGFGNAALAVGESYFDPESEVRITTLSEDGASLVVQVEIGAAPPFAVDRHANPSNPLPNGVLENGETVTVEPSFTNGGAGALGMTGVATAFGGPGAGATYTITDSSADYGTVPPGERLSCFDATGDCFTVMAFAAVRPSLHWDATFEETLSDTVVRTWPIHVGRSFSDVPSTRGDYRFVETVFHHGITSGCGGTAYCPENDITRAQMAVLLLRAEHGAAYVPPPATGTVFADVPANAFAAAWIERLADEGITAGCGSGANFCPNSPVTRAQMAVFLLKTTHGPAWVPPAASGDFTDVPVSNPFAPWVEALKDEGVTAGCGVNVYCPSSATRRGQMATFLTKAFGLSLYGP
jgi:hypothetical protein